MSMKDRLFQQSRPVLGGLALLSLLGAMPSACGSVGDDPNASSGSGPAVITGTGGGSSSGSGGAGGAGGTGMPEPEKLGPPYPIVLAHGFFGTDNFAGLDFATYFFNVKEHLNKQGEMYVYTPAVDPFNSSDYRGDQLIAHIEKILKETGYAKVNIIGHSQGGLDARAVAHKRPDLVASVVTVATPHYGAPVADVVLQLVDDPLYQDVLNELLKLIGAPLYDDLGNETDVFKALYLFSQPGINEFNASHPNQPGVYYASVTGRSDNHDGGSECTPDVPQSFISAWDSEMDPIDAALSISEGITDGGIGKSDPNDGLVRVKDARWGIFWGCIPADHLDQVGQLFGDKPGLSNSWNHLDFYTQLVERIRLQGF